MKNHYYFLKTVLLAGLFIFQLPQESAATGFKDLFGIARNGKAAGAASNARMAAVKSLPLNSDIFIPNTTGTGWVMTGKGRYTYDAQGNQTSYTLYTLANQPFSKDSTLYDPQGNEIFNASYQWQGNAWVMDWGSRSQRTYNPAGKITESVYQYLNNGVWANSYREETIYNPAGNPIEQVNSDWQGMAWEPEDKMVFSYGTPGNNPTEILFQEYNMGIWDDSLKFHSLTWHNFANFQPTAYEGQAWTGTAWENMIKGNVIYDPFGGSVSIDQEWDNGVWVNTFRYTETYDNKMNYTNTKEESWQSNAWVVDFESGQTLTYNAADEITERIYRQWDFQTNTLTDYMRETYSNFQVLATAKNLPLLNVKVYPNPATDRLWVQVEGTEAAAAVLTDLTGRVVLNQQLPAGANQQLNLSGLAKGTYVLKLETKKGMSIQKIVKQ